VSRSFKIITLGCKVNQFESAALKSSLMELGLREAARKERADITVVNTCIVTQKAAHQSRQAIRAAAKANPSGLTAAIGCYAQVYPEELSPIPGIGLVAGNSVKPRLPEIIADLNAGDPQLRILEDFADQASFECRPVRGFLNRTRAFLKVQDGCQSFCSYCIVPLARGPLRSLKPSQVLHILEDLSGQGFKEVVLTGVHLGKYGFDLEDGEDLKGLLRLIGGEGLPLRIRLSSIEPNEIEQELIDMVASEDWLCRHFHIPLQSGDNTVLERMKRPYRVEAFRDLLCHIHDNIPLAAIGVDIMAGFPGEDKRAHRNTLSLIQDLPISYLHVFPFSPRKGTEAAMFQGQLRPEMIKKRTEDIRGLDLRKREVFYGSCIGKDFLVLAEGWKGRQRLMIKGLSDNYLPVLFPSHREVNNEFVTVRIQGLDGLALRGTSSTAESS